MQVRTKADNYYQQLLSLIIEQGDTIETRNATTLSNIFLPSVMFSDFPLITWRNTAVMRSIEEMEWFLSGEAKCPKKLLPWWEKQLNAKKEYIDGYGSQFRNFTFRAPDADFTFFDQIEFLLTEIKEHKYSRRLLLTSWNPGEMANITKINENKNTPTTCHSTMVQFFVRDNLLHMKSYQRSADMLLGVPHNWAQSWSLLLFFAHHTGFRPGILVWTFGDAHIYKEESHLTVAATILEQQLDIDYEVKNELKLEYSPAIEDKVFRASDFKIVGEKYPPITDIKPTLFE